MEAAKQLFGWTGAAAPFGESIRRSSYILPLIGVILTVFLVIVVVYLVLQNRESPAKYLLKDPVDLFSPSDPILVKRQTAAEHMDASYTMAFYLYISECLDMRTVSPILEWPGVWQLRYDPAKAELEWRFAGGERVVISGVELQKWNQLTMTFEGRTVDLYLNGELKRSQALSALPTPSATASVLLKGGAFYGQLAYLELWSRRLTVSEVANSYIDSSDSRGQPYFITGIDYTLKKLVVPEITMNADCKEVAPVANTTQKWEFPYA
jgi:hypothetical protein